MTSDSDGSRGREPGAPTAYPPFDLAPTTWRSGRYRVGRLGLWRALTPLVPPAGEPASRAADVGCGVRPFDVVLGRRGYVPIGVDSAAGSADCLAALPHLPFRDGTFPLALCVNVLQHVDDPITACRELHRILRPGGTVLIVVPHCLPLGTDDYWRWTEHAARTLLSDGGFERMEVVPILPTASIQLHLLALSARRTVPVLGRAVAAALDTLALAGLNSQNTGLTGGYALRGMKPR